MRSFSPQRTRFPPATPWTRFRNASFRRMSRASTIRSCLFYFGLGGDAIGDQSARGPTNLTVPVAQFQKPNAPCRQISRAAGFRDLRAKLLARPIGAL